MKKTEAEEIVHNALAGYIEDCAGENSKEAKQIEKAWKKLKEKNLTPEEINHLKVMKAL